MYKVIMEVRTHDIEQAEKIYDIFLKHYWNNEDIKKLDIDLNLYLEQDLEK